MKLFITLLIALLTIKANAQANSKEPEHELALGIKTVSRNILFGPNEFYVTDPDAIAIQPAGVRYDYPLKLGNKDGHQKYVSLMGQAGFLFGRAKKLDSLYFQPKNPTWFTVAAGLYSMNSLSVGVEIFFWKGLGNRDVFGAKFLSAGYNGKNFRLYVSGEYYMQLLNSDNNGTLLSLDFFWKLIKGGADKKMKGNNQ